MPMSGADVDALRRLAWALRTSRAELDATNQRVSAIVDTLPWAGVDHDQFVDDWHRVHRQHLASMAGELGAAADQIRHHARRQEMASQRR